MTREEPSLDSSPFRLRLGLVLRSSMSICGGGGCGGSGGGGGSTVIVMVCLGDDAKLRPQIFIQR